MRFLYTTDLHGDCNSYEAVLRYALSNRIKLIHLGADLLPKGSHIIELQKQFLKGYFKEYYARCSTFGIKLLAFFGNDDIYTGKKHFIPYGSLLDEKPYEQDGYIFTAYGFVPDYPFGLKSACKSDYKGWTHPLYWGRPVDIGKTGLEDIINIEEYFDKKGTIEEDLQTFKGGPTIIAAIHSPPTGLGLDMVARRECVGSKAVMEWVDREQPLLLLSGHIHESPGMTNIWKGTMGKSTVIQPGQYFIVDIQIENGEVKSDRYPI